MGSPSILRIERMNYILTIVAVVIGLITQNRGIVLGLMVGGGLTCLNFYVLRRLVVKWTADAAAGKGGNAQLLMLPKMVFMMGAAAVAVLFLPIDIIAFIVGYSIFILSIVIEATLSAFRAPGTQDPTSENGHG
jgi:hypothetical protein